MSPAQDHEPGEGDDDILAAEYVVGLLPAAERVAVAARIERDRDFAARVDRWEGRLAPLGDDYDEVAPPAAVKAALERQLFATGDAAAQARLPRPGLWASLALWRAMAAAAVLALAVVLALPYLPGSPGSDQGGRLVASLAPQQSDVHYFVVYDARARDIGLSHVTGERAAGHDFELWVIGSEQPPVSLGLIPDGSSTHIAVSEDLRRKIAAGAVFAISLEPAGGSPTGEPTGPVVAAGDLRDI